MKATHAVGSLCNIWLLNILRSSWHNERHTMDIRVDSGEERVKGGLESAINTKKSR